MMLVAAAFLVVAALVEPGDARPLSPPPRVRARRRRPHDRDELPDVVLLLAVGLLSGHSLPQTCREVARWTDGPIAEPLRVAVDRHRLGEPLLDALDEAATETELAVLLPLLRSHGDDGVAIADALLELAAALRDDRRRQAETRARRLPVRMLLPLILCVLPGFLLLTVAPVIVESLRSVSL